MAQRPFHHPLLAVVAIANGGDNRIHSFHAFSRGAGAVCAVDKLKDGDRVAARVELGANVPVTDVDEWIGELFGGGRDQDFRSGKDGACRLVGGHDGHVRDERERGVAGCERNELRRERVCLLVNCEKNIVCGDECDVDDDNDNNGDVMIVSNGATCNCESTFASNVNLPWMAMCLGPEPTSTSI